MGNFALETRDQQLNLLLELDKARDALDTLSDPALMFQQIARTLRRYFQADAAAIFLADGETAQPEITIGVGMPEDMVEKLGQEAMQFKTPQALASSAWQHTLALRILIDKENRVPGAVILARDSAPFSEEDALLLQVAETQIDSAVLQARTVYRLAIRNRELEAIYQIDRLRDDAADEDTLYANFASLLMQHFQASFCQFIIADLHTNALVTRKLLNPDHLPTAVLEAIVEATRDIQTTTRLDAPEMDQPLKLMASPLIISGERFGAVVIGREQDFSISDTRLMVALASQMDSAIAKTRIAHQLAQRNRELEAIYRIDHIRDQNTDLEEMLKHVLTELCRAIDSETGFLLLYNEQEEHMLEFKATTHEDLLRQAPYRKMILEHGREALDSGAIVTDNALASPLRSVLVTPLILNEQIIGVVGALNSNNPLGFSDKDGRMLRAITSQVDTAIFERLERRRMRRVLARSVDPKVLNALLARADDSLLAGERVVMSMLFADLRGSTEWAEQTAPDELVSLLNMFLSRMTEIIFEYNGTLDKFVGDEIIALFGSPLPMVDHAIQAARAGLKMQAAHSAMRRELSRMGQILPPMGVGISTGEVIAGEFGPPIRTDFTAMGRAVNLGSRLCSAAKPDQIIISEQTYAAIQPQAVVKALDPITPKGISIPVQVYELLKLNP